VNAGAPKPEGSTGPARALELAHRFISRRERTEMEVRGRLQRADVRPDEIEAAVRELVELGYVDDARYARLFTEDRRSLDAWGSDRIAKALRQRGVSRDLITAALESGSDGAPGSAPDGGDHWPHPSEVELQRAVALLAERFPAGPACDRDRSRAFGVLARKGYESETAANAVRAWALDRTF
jgi:regulatory protein